MMALSSQLYMVMYLLMFAAAVNLRFSQPVKAGPYPRNTGRKSEDDLYGFAGYFDIAFLFFLRFYSACGDPFVRECRHISFSLLSFVGKPVFQAVDPEKDPKRGAESARR